MTKYVVELYVSRAGSGSAEQAAARARAAADQLRREGREVQYVRSIYVPEDETCFHVYEAATAQLVVEASRRGGVTAPRIREAVQLEPRRGPAHDQLGASGRPPPVRVRSGSQRRMEPR